MHRVGDPAEHTIAPVSTAPDERLTSRWTIRLAVAVAWVGVVVWLWSLRSPSVGWIALWFAATLIAVGVRRRRALPFNVGWVFVLIAGAELIAWAGTPDEGEMTPSNASALLSAPHPVLGYAPVPQTTVRERRVFEGRTSFDVTYTIGADGWRVRPPGPVGVAPEGSVLCLGCSHMFGWGVDDDATLAWRLDTLLGGQLRVHNLAFSGWGPHQALAAIEERLVDRALTAPPRHVVLLTMGGHAERVAGKVTWDKRGPRYVLTAAGGVERAGSFVDHPPETYWERRWRKFRQKSWVLRRLVQARPSDAHDVELLIAVTVRLRDTVEARWPGCLFHVLAWNVPPRFDEAAKVAGLRVHDVSTILEGPGPWTIDRFDGHLNAAGHAALAAYLAEKVIQR
jgi:hypothetical protein